MPKLPTDKMEQMMDLIDFGGSAETKSHAGRVWTMDPIDGTLTYLEGGQYVVMLTLLVDGKEQVAALACPSLSMEPRFTSLADGHPIDPETPGYIVSTFQGQGYV